ncbi:MAG: hypothetical protein GWP08_12975 [Nitrospiraceae bacterium]|nr:hypothetical protein [Nitrospiraceae bacterium]
MTAGTDGDRDAARRWTAQLEEWILQNGLRGYDPFDVKAHPFLQRAQPYPLLRKGSSLLLDLFPVAARRLLNIPPTANAKAYALCAHAELRLHQVSGDETHLTRAMEHLDWLCEHRCPGGAGWSWGYPFDVSGRGIHRPAGTPVGVVTSVAGEAFALAHAITGDARHRDAVGNIGDFFLVDINQMPQVDGTRCFSYTPVDEWPVHNANLHAVAHLFRTTAVTGDPSYRETAEPGLAFSLSRQRADGSWPYGEWSPTANYERTLLDTVDHHHTGFVLRSLHEIHAFTQRPEIREAIVHGFGFYQRHLFTNDGIPRITTRSTYPVNIHACTEGIVCPAVLSGLVPDALPLAERTIEWTRRHMASPATGLPYYRKYPWFTNRLLCTRWGLAWTFYALCEYLYRAQAASET